MQRKLSTILVSILVLAIAIFLGSRAGKYFGERQKLKEKSEFSEQFLAKMEHLNIGDTLPNHKFEVIGGDSVWLKDLLSKKCVLTIMLPGCEDCLYEAQELKAAITDSNDARHFIFATWENPRTFEDMKNENNLASPFLYDHKRAYFSNYDITTFPFNITLDENGVVLDMLSGSMWKEDFREIIEFNKRAGAKTN
jgi:peroxiredoxin